jgi:alkylhydroperoxidase/carboxymuconolactone decarboxylase family protein YurZ
MTGTGRRSDDRGVTPDEEDLLRRLALNEEGALESVLGRGLDPGAVPGLDAERVALVRLAGLIALGAEPASYQWVVSAALAAGASDAAVVGVLVAVAPITGSVRVSTAAPEVALALGSAVDLPSPP